MQTRTYLGVLCACLLIASNVRAEEAVVSTEVVSITSLDATNHIGKTVKVCGTVAQTRFLSDSLNKYTFINLDGRYPNEPFCIIIEQSDRVNFSEPPEILYRDKKICVTGLIEKFNAKAQVKVKDPSQITIEAVETTAE